MDGSGLKGEVGMFMVVGCAAQVAVLAHGGVRADFDNVHAVTIHIVSQRGVVVHDEVPRAPDFGTRIDAGFEGNLCAEDPEDTGAQAVAGTGNPSKDRRLNNVPELPPDPIAKAVGAGLVGDVDVV